MTDTTRDAFEAWARYLDISTEQDGWQGLRYTHSHVQSSWEGWQAATEQGQPQWLPIAAAPKDGTEYWATDGTHYFTESKPPKCFPGQWRWFEKERCWGGSMSTYKATHFMPLPLPPTATPQGKI